MVVFQRDYTLPPATRCAYPQHPPALSTSRRQMPCPRLEVSTWPAREDLDTTGGRGSRVHNRLAVVIGTGSLVVEVATALAGQVQQWVRDHTYTDSSALYSACQLLFCFVCCVRGQYFEKHLKFIRHNVNPVSFTKIDLSYLLKVCHQSCMQLSASNCGMFENNRMAPWKNRTSWYISFFCPSLNGVLFPMFCLLVEGECQILVFLKYY